MTEMRVRQWQERFRAGDFSSKDSAVQCEDVYKRQTKISSDGSALAGVTYSLTRIEDGSRYMDQTTSIVKIEEQWLTGDVRPGRESEQWLNFILRKV